MTKRKVILVTDGDQVARRVVEHVAARMGGRTISLSGGNPTPLTGEQIVELIKKAAYDPVFVMFDDNGMEEEGAGEQAMKFVAESPDIEVLGAVAVASNAVHTEGICADVYIDNRGNVIPDPVDKYGMADPNRRVMHGDTIHILNRLQLPVIVGIGDIGKMDGRDHLKFGSPITTSAVEYILKYHGYPVVNGE